MTKIKDPEDCRHPDDIEMKRVAEAEAAADIDAWFAARIPQFKALVQTYADIDALKLFEQLREEFWTRETPSIRALRSKP